MTLHSESADGSSSAGARPVIFVVDDDAAHCVLVSELLRDADYDVEVATSCRDALQRLAEAPAPNLILLDMIMPEMDGWAFMQSRRCDPVLSSIPVVVMSGGGDSVLSRAPVASGYLAKPLVPERLLQAVGRCLAMQHLTRGQS
jgi:CheY-like chemotaxis protein